jgi:two-component system, sporulation sensor kinase E
MLRKFTNWFQGLSLAKYSNDLLFALILFVASFTAITTIVRTQERSLESDLMLKSSLIKDAVINQSKLNFLLSDSIGFLDLHNQIFERGEQIIQASFYDIDGNLIWGHPKDNPSTTLEIPDEQDYITQENSIFLKFPVIDNSDETLGFMQFKCDTKGINQEIKSLRIRLFVLSSILIITLLTISLWARSKLIFLTRSQALTKARVELSEKNNTQLETENKILEIISGQNNLYDIGLEIVKFVGQYLNTRDTVLFAYLDDELVKIASLRDNSKGKSKGESIEKLKLGQGICGSVALSRKGMIIPDTSVEPNYVQDGQHMRSEVTVPIIIDNELIGVLDAEHAELDYFSKTHFEFLIKISNLIALGLRNSISRILIERKDSELRSSAERLENIIENLPRGIAFENDQEHIAHLNQKFIDLMGLEAKPEDIIGLHCNQAREMLANVFLESERFSERTIEIIKNREIVSDDTLKLRNGRSVTRHYAPVYQDGEFIGNLWAYADNTIETRFYENLNYEREKYMNIIANMEIGLLEVDNDDRIMTANKSFLKMTNYDEVDLIGKIGHEILVSKEEGERIKKMNASRIDGESSIYEIEYFTKDRKVRHMLVSGGPNRDIKGNVIGSIGIHLDISKLKELEQLREELIQNLTESNDELSNYAHVVSHDLKTPLRSISAAMSWLKEDNQDSLDEMSQSYLAIVDEALLKMDKIISDTLRYSELRRKSSKESEVDLNNLLKHLIAELKQSYPETTIEISGKLPSLVINDTKAIQIFQNILDNACKYRDPERKSMVKISCGVIFGFYEFQIQDNGIGISKEYEHHVFEIFQKLNNNKDSNGVGMSIVKKIVENYGGNIWFESEVGKGTTFKFNLPRALTAKA